jgi:hypothetical protein
MRYGSVVASKDDVLKFEDFGSAGVWFINVTVSAAAHGPKESKTYETVKFLCCGTVCTCRLSDISQDIVWDALLMFGRWVPVCVSPVLIMEPMVLISVNVSAWVGVAVFTELSGNPVDVCFHIVVLPKQMPEHCGAGVVIPDAEALLCCRSRCRSIVVLGL